MPATILTIEDQPDIRRLIRMTLEFAGHRVLEADDGPSGLALLRRERPALVLLDVMMPGMSGLEVARAIADDPSSRELPVIFITSNDDEHDRQAGLALGAVAYLRKPFGPRALLALIEERLDPGRSAGAAPAPAGGPDAAPSARGGLLR